MNSHQANHQLLPFQEHPSCGFFMSQISWEWEAITISDFSPLFLTGMAQDEKQISYHFTRNLGKLQDIFCFFLFLVWKGAFFKLLPLWKAINISSPSSFWKNPLLSTVWAWAPLHSSTLWLATLVSPSQTTSILYLFSQIGWNSHIWQNSIANKSLNFWVLF